MTEDLRYPIGRFHAESRITPEARTKAVRTIRETPARMRAAVEGLTDAQLDTSYRDGGWTVRQVVHHVPDSHLNGYVRMKWALTEDQPTIKPYQEAAWAELPDSQGPVEPSLALLDAVHIRWMMLIDGMSEADLARTLVHPEDGGASTVDSLLALYAWHGRHHVAHITSLRQRRGW